MTPVLGKRDLLKEATMAWCKTKREMDPASHWLSATSVSIPTGPGVCWDKKQTTAQPEEAEREIPRYRWSCTDIQCGESVGVMTSRHAENRSYPTYCKSLQHDFPSLVFSEHELVRKRGTHKHRWSMKAKHCQRLLNLWPNATSLSAPLLRAASSAL